MRLLIRRLARHREHAVINVVDHPIRYACLVYMQLLIVGLGVLWAWDKVYPREPGILGHILAETAWTAVAALLFTAWRLRRAGAKPAITFAPWGQGIVSLVLFGIWAVTYFIIKFFIDPNTVRFFSFALDQWIPFNANWTFIYLALYPLFFIPLLAIRDDLLFRKTAWSYVSVMALIWPVFLMYPVSYVRPTFEVVNFATWILDVIYRADSPPYNCLPSMHVAMVFLSGLVMWQVNRFWGLGTFALALGVAVSTTLTKQHYVVDSVASLTVVTVVYFAFFKFDLLERVQQRGRSWRQTIYDRFSLLR